MNINPEIIDLVVKALLGILALCGIWLVHYVKNALKAKTEAEDANQLDVLIYELVAAAEQTLKEKDPTGSLRKRYVMETLQQLGYEVSKEVDARIEAAVYNINLDQPEEHEKVEKKAK